MDFSDGVRFSLSALASHRLRSFLSGLGIAIGIAAVVLLTSIGEGVRHYIVAEFTQFGTNLLAVVPGRTTTFGLSGAVIGTVRPLTLDDELALGSVPSVLATTAVIQGNAAVKAQGRQRRVTVLGVGPKAPDVWNFHVASGVFLPRDDPRAPRAMAVLGGRVEKELFGRKSPLGAMVRVGGMRFRVVGVMESKGQILGFDLDDAIYIPVVKAQELFNRESIMEIDVLYSSSADPETVARRVEETLAARHGKEDFTIITQEQMLTVLGDVLGKLTMAVGSLGAISLVVGGVGILTVMTIAVSDRISEVGLLRALGATRGQILFVFLGEAVILSTLGGLAGLFLGWGGAYAIHALLPALPVRPSPFYAALSMCCAAVIGLATGVAPARRAAILDPVDALRTE